ncbi:MAG: hypothetical protein ABW252_25800 [Polyangiales bacterium]
MDHSRPFSRRNLLKAGAFGATSLGLQGALHPSLHAQAPDLRRVDPKDRKLLFVFCAHGGAGVIDSLLPVVETEVGNPQLASTLCTYPASQVEQIAGSAFKHVKPLKPESYIFMKPPPNMGEFIRRHGQDVALLCHDVSSVNHNVAQARSLNGNGANGGRTIMEAMAMRYGGGMPLPSCNMGIDGFVEHGSDPSIPSRARHETITSPRFFGTGTHGYKGIAGLPKAGSIEHARKVREQLDRETVFAKTFGKSPVVARYLEQRKAGVVELEQAQLLENLLLLDPATLDPKYGLQASALVQQLYKRMPNLAQHDTQSQLGVAFLLAYHGVATSVTFGFRSDPVITKEDGVITAPIAFDFSHSSHRATQSAMWGNLTSLLDNFITLLKEYDYMGDPGLGKMWERSVIYVATDFGRTKNRSSAGAADWSSGHDQNNGSLIISPRVVGNRVYGGVDPKTCLTYGFDRGTGAPNKSVTLDEAGLYGALAHVLDIEYAGREDCPVLLRG